jgi:hypothetical protein
MKDSRGWVYVYYSVYVLLDHFANSARQPSARMQRFSYANAIAIINKCKTDLYAFNVDAAKSVHRIAPSFPLAARLSVRSLICCAVRSVFVCAGPHAGSWLRSSMSWNIGCGQSKRTAHANALELRRIA